MSDPLEQLSAELAVPAFNAAFVPVAFDEDTVHVRAGPHAGLSVSVADEDESGLVADVVAEIDGSSTVEEILAGFPDEHHDEILELLTFLAEKNVIVDAATDRRQVARDYAVVRPVDGDDAGDPLADADVFVVSVGDIGELLVRELDRLGVGSIRVLATHGSVPTADRSSTVERVDDDQLREGVERADAVAFLAESPAPALAEEVNLAASETGTPWILGQIHGYDGVVGPVFFPGETACYRCFRERMAANVDNPEGYRRHRKTLEETHRSAMVPFFAQTVSGYLGMDLLNVLQFRQAFTAGRAIHFDALDLSVAVDDVFKLPRCPVCGPDDVDEARFVSDVDTVVEQLDGGDGS